MVSTIYIAKTVYGGSGLGRLGDGRVVFVPGAFAGENVKAEIVQEKSNYVNARLVEVVEPCRERISQGEMPVPGMVYADLSYKGECEAKEMQLKDALERARIPAPPVRDPGNADFSPLGYRNKTVYHFTQIGAPPRATFVMGYRKERSHEIVDVFSDPLARPEINEKLPSIRDSVNALVTNGVPAVRRSILAKESVTVRWSRLSGVQWWIGEARNPVIMKEATCGRTFEVPSDGFYQVNPEVGEALVKHVSELFGRDPTEKLVDMYCGVGVFGVVLASRTRLPDGGRVSLAGVETGRRAVALAKRNAAVAGLRDANFVVGEAFRNLDRLGAVEGATIIVDPPRSGLERGVPQFLCASGARRIIYVSCDLATLVRDLRKITQRYEIENATWFNMFPRTAKFETVISLKRKP